MSFRNSGSRLGDKVQSILAFVFIFFLVVGFFYLPYYESGKQLAWGFVWCIDKEIVPGVALLQAFSTFILIVFFLLLVRMQRNLSLERERLVSAITNLEVGLFRVAPGEQGRFVEVNDGLLNILGYTSKEFFELRLKDIYDDSLIQKHLGQPPAMDAGWTKEVVFKKKSKETIPVVLSLKAVRNEHKELLYVEGIVMDMSARRRVEEQALAACLRFESVVQNTPNIAVIGFDLDGKVVEWNHASELLYGYSKEEMAGVSGATRFSTEQEALDFHENFSHMKETGRPCSPREWKIKSKNAKILTVYSSMFPVLRHGQVDEVYCMEVDISARVDAETRLSETKNKLESLALKDALTEIYNFRYFRERLASEFERAKRSLTSLSVLLLDIDYFKSINDTYGHQFGDRVLKQVARMLRTELRTNDVVARWGGEEFAVILPETTRHDAHGVAKKILELFHSRNFGEASTTIKLKCSMGLVNYPEDPLFSVEEIIDGMQENLYRVKERGGDGVMLYSHEIAGSVLEKFPEEDRKRYIDAVKQRLSFYAVRSERSILEAVYSLAKSIEMRDRRTREHCDRMVEYAEKMARKLSMNQQDIDNVRRAAMLHDIGKLGISDAVLLKPGKLTPQEYEVVKKHPVIGADIVSVAGFLKDIVPLILSHHERYDGDGYPRGLKGEEIPLGARILAVVDVYEALTSDRPYHKAISKEEAIAIIKEGAGKQFDQKIIEIFLQILDQSDDEQK